MDVSLDEEDVTLPFDAERCAGAAKTAGLEKPLPLDWALLKMGGYVVVWDSLEKFRLSCCGTGGPNVAILESSNAVCACVIGFRGARPDDGGNSVRDWGFSSSLSGCARLELGGEVGRGRSPTVDRVTRRSLNRPASDHLQKYWYENDC